MKEGLSNIGYGSGIVENKREAQLEKVLSFLPTLEEARKEHKTNCEPANTPGVEWETFTREYIEKLGLELLPEFKKIQNSKGGKPLMAVELGAGQGKLTRAMKACFSVFPEVKADFKATDKRSDKNNGVERYDAEAAMLKLKPDVVFISWAPKQTDWVRIAENIKSIKLVVMIGEPDVTGAPMAEVAAESYESAEFEPEWMEKLFPYQLGASDVCLEESLYKLLKEKFGSKSPWVNNSRTIFFRRK